MNGFRRYLLPACVAIGVLSALLSLEGPTAASVRGRKGVVQSTSIQSFFVPHGRALYVIVEENGVYFGPELVTFAGLEGFLETTGRSLKADCALVYGTELARYGHVVSVYMRVHRSLGIETELRTYPLTAGTRRGPIEVHDNHWEYD